MTQNSNHFSSSENEQPKNGYLISASFLYILLIVYGTLFPLSGWQWDIGGLNILLNATWPSQLTRSDVVVNLLIYIPLGYLLCILVDRIIFNSRQPTASMILATLIGAGICILLEYFQTFLPSRITSYVDIALNTAGTMLGAALAVMTGKNTAFAFWLLSFKSKWFVDQPLTNLALLTLFLWAMSQLTPLIPSPDIGNLRNGIKLVYFTILSPSTFMYGQAFTYFFNILALGLLLSIFLNPDQPLLKKLSVFIFLVLLLKIPMIDRQLSLEALAGASAAILLCIVFSSGSSRFQSLLSIFFLLLAFTISGLTAAESSEFIHQQMNWVPFAQQMGSINGLIDITFSIWPFMALACLTLVLSPNGAFLMGMFGILVVLSLSFYIEWSQQYFIDRYPDITDVILAVVTYTISYWRFNKYLYHRPDYSYQPVGKLIE